MKNALDFINKWLGELTEILKSLIVVGVIVGILFDDFFGVIGGIGRVVGQIGKHTSELQSRLHLVCRLLLEKKKKKLLNVRLCI